MGPNDHREDTADPPTGHARTPTASFPPVKVRDRLRYELDGAVAFADYCSFLTGGLCEDRSTQLVEVAEALMAETLDVLEGRVRRPAR